MITSKLPKVGTTIFTVMSALANQEKAINLSQGFPDFEANPQMIDLVSQYMKQGFNQYAPMAGVWALREAIAEKTAYLYGVNFDPETEITVVSGASEALFNILACLVNPEDEVIIFEPAYDLYIPAIELFGGVPVCIPLRPDDYSIDWQKVAQAISPNTKAIMLNSPHNPSGAVLKAEDLENLQKLIAQKEIIVISDEVYEHIIFDNVAHESVLKYPPLRDRSFVVSSFGKTYHTTGWKIGYCIAPEPLTKEFRKIHQFNTFSTNTPIQYALADFLKNKEEYLQLPQFYQERRDKFREMLSQTPFRLLPCAGTYFQLVSYSHLSNEKDTDYTIRLTKEIGVATIPVSVFYADTTDHHVIRFCFAKRYETLEEGIHRLVRKADLLSRM